MRGILDGCNGVGHSMSKGGSWSPSVKSKVTSDQTRKEGNPHKGGIDWPTHETSGKRQAQGRKEGGRRA
jgi:hypothetical protein